MIALTTPFGNYIYASAESAVKSFGFVVKQSFNSAGVDYEEPTFNDGTIAGTPVLRGKNTGYVDEARGYVYGIPAGTSDLSGLFEIENGSFKTPDGVKTGASFVVKKTDDSIYKTYTVIIFGDVNGDGEITSIDESIIYNATNGITISDPAMAFAADVTGDGDISLLDSAIVYDATNGIDITVNPYA